MTITGEHANFWYEGCIAGAHQEACHLHVFDRYGYLAGVVVMDGATFEQTTFSQTCFTFIKIPQTKISADDSSVFDESLN
jgi:hypothetical protein